MKKVLIAIIRFYRKNISPNLPSSCRFYPTCSVYAIRSIDKFGAFKGSILTIYRILRCNPFCKGGVDNVPEKFSDAFKHRELKDHNHADDEDN